MRSSFVSRAAAAALIVWAILAGSGAARAESVMAACAGQWKQAQAAGTTGGKTWPEFLAGCKAQVAAPAAPAQAAPAQPAPAQPAPAQAASGESVMAVCAGKWKQAKAAGTTGGATWPEFLSACRKQGAGSSSASAPPAPSSAPAPGGSSFPWWRPSGGGEAAPTGAGQFRSAAEAGARCPTDKVVWLNTSSKIYHAEGGRWYARTRQGAYMCEADAKAAGARAARTIFGRQQK